VNKYSEHSQIQLSTCHPDLKKLFYRVLLYRDHSILEGHRTKEDQDIAFALGHSKVEWPNSKHNTSPSIAVDVQPYPAPEGPRAMWEWMNWIGFVQGVAAELKIKIRNGADWDRDLDLDDTSFVDAYHFELVEPAPLPSVEVEEGEPDRAED
jgi:peptidoglycan L-alanyl-D-glutamate endopeptidase CwlK